MNLHIQSWNENDFSDDYLYIVQLILDNGTPNEQILIVSSIWRLIVQNYKGRSVIKNSKIYVKLRKQYEKLRLNTKNLAINAAYKDIDDNQSMEVVDDLCSALEHVVNILSS